MTTHNNKSPQGQSNHSSSQSQTHSPNQNTPEMSRQDKNGNIANRRPGQDDSNRSGVRVGEQDRTSFKRDNKVDRNSKSA
jgi:hypothetical protein